MHTISPYLAEFLGTLIMCTIGCGAIATVELRRSKGHGDNFFTIAFGWGFAVAFGVYASHPYSGGHLNPAVSVGLAAFGEFDWAKVPGYVIAQLLGAMAGAGLVYLNYLPHWKATADQKIKLGVFSTVPAIHNYFTNALSEIIGTFMLVFSALYTGVNFKPTITTGGVELSPEPQRCAQAPRLRLHGGCARGRARRADRVRPEPGARSGAAHYARSAAHSQ